MTAATIETPVRSGPSYWWASYTAMLPIYARDILEIGPEGLGWLHSMIGAGSITGMATAISRSQSKPSGPHRSGISGASTGRIYRARRSAS